MATSSKTLTQIINTICDEYELDRQQILKQLSTKDLLPAKLLLKSKPKNVPFYASKQAEELATLSNLILDEGMGSGKHGKYTLADVKKAIEIPHDKKILISPTALNFANDQNISISEVIGTGKDSRILLSDVKKYIKESVSDSDSDSDSASDSDSDSE